MLGACAAVAALIPLLGLGLGELLRRHPLLQQGLAWLGVGWLSYLAWSLFRSAGGIDGAGRRGASACSAARRCNWSIPRPG